jgi:NSS family neurotransmitter:Na+ symporter
LKPKDVSKKLKEWSLFMSKKEHPQWKSRFGYIMVAAGAAIGLGNIWRFPYLAYAGGGGIFILLYLILAVIMGHPMVEMESAIGRYGRGNVAASFGAVNKRYKFIGIIAVICTTLIDIYYVVEKVTKVIMPALFILLLICGVWAIFSTEGAVEGLKYYLLPDFSKLSVKVFADAATQILFSVGIGWGIFITLGASLPRENNIKKDAMWITLCDTAVALLAGFVIIPSAFGAGVDVASGPSLIFVVMTQIFDNLPGGRIIGLFFFVALVFAVFSTLFTIVEIPVKWVEESFKLKHKLATVVVSLVIFLGSILVSLGFGMLKDLKLPWIDANGLAAYNLYDWLDTATAYVLLPLGCILTCFYIVRVWGIAGYEKELTADGRDGKVYGFQKMLARIVIPVLMIIVILNCFGFIR